jgi:hypothetical protein
MKVKDQLHKIQKGNIVITYEVTKVARKYLTLIRVSPSTRLSDEVKVSLIDDYWQHVDNYGHTTYYTDDQIRVELIRINIISRLREMSYPGCYRFTISSQADRDSLRDACQSILASLDSYDNLDNYND